MLRLIHTADWQLGKPYGRFDSDVRAALSEARFDAIDAVGKAAVDYGTAHVLVAGDVFDTEGPEDRVIVQAVSRMPVSLILDDPLVYSDDTRLDLMTEILTDAATRMQVILLTCRDRAFRHLGNRISLAGVE